MQALIDGIVFQNSYQRGIQRYFAEVISRLANEDDTKCKVIVEIPTETALPPHVELIDREAYFPVWRSDLKWRVRQKVRKLFNPTRFPTADIFHSTFFTRSPIAGLPEVLTVYDMIPETVPHFFWGNADMEIARKRDCIESAAAIMTISAATRDDLVRIYPDVAQRVTVVHLGAEHLLSDQMGSSAVTPNGSEPYILFVGERAGYKNFAIMMDALRESEWPIGFRLAVVGRPFSEAEKTALRYRGIESRVLHLGRVSDLELGSIYRSSSGFVFPSMAEGFGFPMLEAQSLGVPVAASDIVAFNEVGGDAFVPFPPLDAGRLAQAVKRIVDPTVRSDLVTKGAQNLQRFSWSRCAQQTEAVWRSII